MDGLGQLLACPQSLMLLKAVQPGPAEVATSCESLKASSRWPRATHRVSDTSCTGVSPKGPPNQTPTVQLQTTPKQDLPTSQTA